MSVYTLDKQVSKLLRELYEVKKTIEKGFDFVIVDTTEIDAHKHYCFLLDELKRHEHILDYEIKKKFLNHEYNIKNINEEIRKLKKRLYSEINKKSWLSDFIAYKTDYQNKEGSNYKFQFRKSQYCEIKDLNSIPAEFLKVEFKCTPKLREILKAVKNKKEVPGAEVHTRKILKVK